MGIEGVCKDCGFFPTLDYSCLRCTQKERDAALLRIDEMRKLFYRWSKSELDDIAFAALMSGAFSKMLICDCGDLSCSKEHFYRK